MARGWGDFGTPSELTWSERRIVLLEWLLARARRVIRGEDIAPDLLADIEHALENRHYVPPMKGRK